MRIAVDAMGGDNAPGCVIEGVRLALDSVGGLERIYLAGDEPRLRAAVQDAGLTADRVEIVHAPEVVEMGEPPASAVRRKKRSSIAVSVDLVKQGICQAVVSAGNTGAAVAATTIKLRLLPGIDRPGIASPIPNDHGMCSLIDAGANPDPKPHHLLAYGVMGAVYARHVLGVANPRIGLMSLGEEDSKGTDFTKEVFRLLRTSGLNFVGNVEGHDLFESPLDVVLCDGFIGNVVLKSCEATAHAMFKWLKQELTKTPVRHFGAFLARNAFAGVKERVNYENYGGSPLLGVNGICIIGHGSSSAKAIQNAVRVAAEAIAHEVNPHIVEELQRLGATHA
ncbi:MAG TPA: phosphate acyltransferase PlsX [Verrucomicrobiales bacterium]|nr:phosphate acyltransferase PlsX [Verrucomicrobiales bacterium]